MYIEYYSTLYFFVTDRYRLLVAMLLYTLQQILSLMQVNLLNFRYLLTMLTIITAFKV